MGDEEGEGDGWMDSTVGKRGAKRKNKENLEKKAY
jgi:hypothetical protein